ncbi:MAG: hypothetical protein K0S39_626 [Paenibacillus sp.]|jgi:GntR family transcriptional regulator|nr:hypothetical protein [Paenibacillus sp.]
MLSKSMQVKRQLEQMIERGDLRIGDRLPSEIEMSRQFGVSRVTFRDAVKLMEGEGRLLVKHGVGTFVIHPLPTIPSSLEKLSGTGDMIRSAGLQEGESQEQLSVKVCPDDIADLLGLEAGASVVVLERVRTADGEPVVFSVNYMPVAVVGNIFEANVFSGSLLGFLERHLPLHILRADSEIAVPLHIDRYCQRLLLYPQSTVLLLKQLHYDEANRPVLYSLDYMRNDVFRFWIRRSR